MVILAGTASYSNSMMEMNSNSSSSSSSSSSSNNISMMDTSVNGRSSDRKRLSEAVKFKRNHFDEAYLKVSKRYSISKSTLWRRINRTPKARGGQCVFSAAQETVFVGHLLVMASWLFPITRDRLKDYVNSFLFEQGLKIIRFKNNTPGKDWLAGFFKRHPEIKVRRCQNITFRKAYIKPKVVEDFFDNMKPMLAPPGGNEAAVSPTHILNYDETNLTNDPGNANVIVDRGEKHPRRAIAHSRTGISVMFTGTAAGKILAPYVVYKAKSVKDEWTAGFPPPNAHYDCSSSGWFKMQQFERWFIEIVVPWAKAFPLEEKKLVLGDNLASHFSNKVMTICRELNISFKCFPPNTTHFLQPLDVAFFGPLKRKWRETLEQWRREKPRTTFSKVEFPNRLRELINVMNPDNLKRGFAAAGICPFNPAEAMKHLPAVHPEQVKDADGQILVNYLRSEREDRTATTGKPRATAASKRPAPGMDLQCIPGEGPESNIQLRTTTEPDISTAAATPPDSSVVTVTVIPDNPSSLSDHRVYSNLGTPQSVSQASSVVPVSHPSLLTTPTGSMQLRRRKIPSQEQLLADAYKYSQDTGSSMTDAARKFGVKTMAVRLHCKKIEKKQEKTSSVSEELHKTSAVLYPPTSPDC